MHKYNKGGKRQKAEKERDNIRPRPPQSSVVRRPYVAITDDVTHGIYRRCHPPKKYKGYCHTISFNLSQPLVGGEASRPIRQVPA